MSLLIELAVELAHLDGFGVEDVSVDFGLALVGEGGHCAGEDFVGLGLATTGGAHEHEAVADLDGVVELLNLIDKLFLGYQIEPFSFLFYFV